MKPSKTLIRACQVLRARVRFKNAGFHRPGDTLSDRAYSDEIRKATAVYVESWIVPLLDAIEQGDIALLDEITSGAPLSQLGEDSNL